MGCGNSKITKVVSATDKSSQRHDLQIPNDGLDSNDKKFLENVMLVNIETVGSDDEDEGFVEELSRQDFQPNYVEFPTHLTLKHENRRYCERKRNYGQTSQIIDQTDMPEPSDVPKDALFKQKDFAELDKYAFEAPKHLLHKSVAEVVTYLTAKCKTGLQKARVIFRWCCAQNLDQLPEGKAMGTILQLLQNIKNDLGSYDSLYRQMCSVAGIKYKEIRGFTKAAGYTVGDDIDFINSNGSWTAIQINGIWRLIDVNFAARHQTGGGHGEWELIDDNGEGYKKLDDAPVGLTYVMDEFYFLTNPEEFIYNHFPEEEEWQLLARPVTKEEYQNMVQLRSHFFELAMDVKKSRRGIIHAPSGESIIKWALPKGSERRFMYHLWKSNKDGNTDNILGQNLSQFVYLEQSSGNLFCKVMFPLTGKYKLDLFARDDSTEGHHYSLCGAYLLLCTKEKEDFCALPRNTRNEWGPGQDVTKLGMTPITHPNGTIETEDGEVEIKFKMNKPVDILAGIRGENKSKHDLEQWLIHREQNGEVNINLKMQEVGIYALDIYAKPHGEDGTYPHVCTYLVNASGAVLDKVIFPKIANQQAGRSNQNREINLIPVSHTEAYFISSEGYEEIVFEYSPLLEFLIGLHHQTDGEVSDIEGHIFIEQTENRVTFKTRFPKAGIYLIDIFAKPKATAGTYPYVYAYVVYVSKPMEGCRPFAKTYSSWGVGCRVSGLNEGILPEDDAMEVKAVLPNAVAVAVIGDKWTHLDQNDGEWIGNIDTGKAGKKLQLAACYKKGKSYDILAECEVKTKEELGIIEEKQHKDAEIEEEMKRKREELEKKRKEEFEKLKKSLIEATNAKNFKLLYKAVDAVEAKSYTHKLKEEYTAAKNLIKSLERIEKLQRAVLKMNIATMAEIKSYGNPPPAVHEVMVATLLLLKEHEDTTKDWKKCQPLCNTTRLKKQVKNFDVYSLHPEIAARARWLLQAYRLEDVADKSSGAACFYAWTIGMVEELNIIHKGSVRKAKPADLARQKEIFKGKV